MLDASALMDSALHDVSRRPDLAAEAAEVQLDRASLALEAGLLRGDTRLLDQAGRDLRAVVASASPEYRPVTRARALSLCAAGLSALAAMAGDARRAPRRTSCSTPPPTPSPPITARWTGPPWSWPAPPGIRTPT